MKRHIPPSAKSAIDLAVMAIRSVRVHGELLAMYSAKTAESLDAIDEALRVLRETDPSDDLRRLHERILRLRELRNQMELGAWQIQVSHAMDDAYRRTP